jgi:O-antigen/teichoic acid export membrane protein
MDDESLAEFATPEEDFTGRDRMAWNVLASWGGHLVYVVAGFIMPRLIDRHLGQAELGLWDFGWTTVSYFGIAGIGIGSSVNRYVAKHRALGDVEDLRRAVSSVAVVQFVSALVILVGTAALTWQLPRLFGGMLGSGLGTARWVVALLGLGLAIQTAFDYFRGVMTGCHRWDLHNAINSGSYALTVIGMVAVLRAGGGLRGLAAVNLVGYVAAEAARAAVAFRVCPELRVKVAYASWARVREMTYFGAKTLTNGVSRLLLVQANSLLLAAHAGVAALAIYSRPLALMRHVETLTSKFAFVLAPTASSLETAGSRDQLRQLLVDTTRLATYLALPMLLGLAILGDAVVNVWMGAHYESGLVVAVLALGAVLPVSQQPSVQILTGLNLHGRLSAAGLVAALGGVAVGVVLVGYLGYGMPGAALALSLASTGNGFYIAAYSSRSLGVPLGRYVWLAYARPVSCNLPYAGCLLASRWVFASDPLTALVVGCGSGGAVLAAVYGRYVWPQLREKLR